MKIAIVSNNLATIQILEKILLTKPEMEITWITYNGASALQKCAMQRPDVLLMDLDLPVMNGVEAIYHIMRNFPCAILILTDNIHKKAGLIFEAMGHGALDVLNTLNLQAESLFDKIHNIAILIGKASFKYKQREKEAFQERNIEHPFFIEHLPPLLLIGASTGGPTALARILSFLPSNPAIATIVVQHIDQQFVSKLADWLEQKISLSVKLATHDTHPIAGTVLLAGAQNQFVMNKKLELTYISTPLEEDTYHPSIDACFSSVAINWPRKSVAVLLTGMGNDGALGLKRLHEAGWHTIAQHEEGCVVYAMPKAAIDMGAASEILKLPEIAPAIFSRIFSFYP